MLLIEILSSHPIIVTFLVSRTLLDMVLCFQFYYIQNNIYLCIYEIYLLNSVIQIFRINNQGLLTFPQYILKRTVILDIEC